MLNYPIGDFLIQIKNAGMAGRHEVVVANTKLIKAVAAVLKEEGILEEVKVKENKLTAKLKYHKKAPVLLNLKLVSRPGVRIYMNVDELSKRRAPSILVLSTSQGILADRKALKKGIGGEVIVEIW